MLMSLAALSDSRRICLVTFSGTAGIAEDTAATTALMMSLMSEGASRADLMGVGAAGMGDCSSVSDARAPAGRTFEQHWQIEAVEALRTVQAGQAANNEV